MVIRDSRRGMWDTRYEMRDAGCAQVRNQFQFRILHSAFIITVGAGRENRTLMVSPPRDFESRASTNSAIPARGRDYPPLRNSAASRIALSGLTHGQLMHHDARGSSVRPRAKCPLHQLRSHFRLYLL
jgi:hypothetical protein